MSVEERVKELGIILPVPAKPVAEYVPVKQVGKLLYISGQDCKKDGKLLYEGKVGKELSVEQGQEAARQCMVNALGVLKQYLGNLDEIKQVVKVLGFVNSADGFVLQPAVINGGSKLLVEVFGEEGRHSRSAISSNELPFNTPVEIELIVEMEQWNPEKIYDRMGVDTQFVSLLGVKVPSLTIPVRPGRNLAVILEVAAMNNRQKKMGYNAASDLLDHLGLEAEAKEVIKDYDAF